VKPGDREKLVEHYARGVAGAKRDEHEPTLGTDRHVDRALNLCERGDEGWRTARRHAGTLQRLAGIGGDCVELVHRHRRGRLSKPERIEFQAIRATVLAGEDLTPWQRTFLHGLVNRIRRGLELDGGWAPW